MTCSKCNGYGIIFLSGKTPKEIIKKCSCVKEVKNKSLSLRRFYKDSDSFMSYEAMLQHELDYEDYESFMRANGSPGRLPT